MESLAELSHDPNPAAAAQCALDKLKINGEARRLLMPAVVDYFRARRRSAVHNIERDIAAFQGPTREAMTAARLLSSGFMLRTRFVLWADATVADHQERIDLLRAKVAGINATVALHEKALRVLESTGRTCLGELAADLTGAAA